MKLPDFFQKFDFDVWFAILFGVAVVGALVLIIFIGVKYPSCLLSEDIGNCYAIREALEDMRQEELQ